MRKLNIDTDLRELLNGNLPPSEFDKATALLLIQAVRDVATEIARASHE